MKEKINRVLFDNGADLDDIDPVYLVKFLEEELESLSLEMDEYYSIYREVKKICRFTVKLRLRGLDYSDGMHKSVESFSVATQMSLDDSIDIIARSLETTKNSMRDLGEAMLIAGSKLNINNK